MVKRKLNTAAAAALCITDGAGVQPGAHAKPTLTDFGLQPYLALVCHLMFRTSNTWITTYLTTPEGWKAELAYLADTSRTVVVGCQP